MRQSAHRALKRLPFSVLRRVYKLLAPRLWRRISLSLLMRPCPQMPRNRECCLSVRYRAEPSVLKFPTACKASRTSRQLLQADLCPYFWTTLLGPSYNLSRCHLPHFYSILLALRRPQHPALPRVIALTNLLDILDNANPI